MTQDLLTAFINLVRFCLGFARVDRGTFHEDGKTRESDADHTVMLGVVATAFAAQYFPSLDLGEIAQLALVHDLVETYSGDVNSLNITVEQKMSKKAREAQALLDIEREFGLAFPWIHQTIQRYERQESREARYVCVMDKVLPKATHLLNQGATFKELGLTFDQIRGYYAKKTDKARADDSMFPELIQMREELVQRIFESVYGQSTRTEEPARPLYNRVVCQYCGIDDDRIAVFHRYMDALNMQEIGTLSTDEIIARCIETLKSRSFSTSEMNDLKEFLLIKGKSISEPYVRKLFDEISLMQEPEISIISLGCGGRGSFEEQLAGMIEKGLPTMQVHWVGIDTDDFREPGSFFSTKAFKKVEENVDIEYRLALDDRSHPAVLIGLYSFHHLGIEFDKFIARCMGIRKVFLLEEPVIAEMWRMPEYRVLRIAYDILANAALNPGWASAYFDCPARFQVNYLDLGRLPLEGKILDHSADFPGTALLVFEPQLAA